MKPYPSSGGAQYLVFESFINRRLTPRIFAAGKNWNRFFNKCCIFVAKSGEGSSGCHLDKSCAISWKRINLLPSVIQRAWTKYLGILHEAIISHKKYEERLCGNSEKNNNH